MVETSFDRFLKEEKLKARSEGLDEGRAEGRVIGIEEGREAGREEGRTAESLNTVRRMLAKGSYSLDEIAEISNLPIEKVRELAEGA